MALKLTSEQQRKDKPFVCKCLTTGQLYRVRRGVFSQELTSNMFSGDPTDTSIKLRPLEPASGQALARDLVLKTRRRKGLGDQIAVSKYLDDEFVVSAQAETLSIIADLCFLQLALSASGHADLLS